MTTRRWTVSFVIGCVLCITGLNLFAFAPRWHFTAGFFMALGVTKLHDLYRRV